MDPLRALIAAATEVELAAIASDAGTSVHYLQYHVLTGRRRPSVALGARLEEVTRRWNRRTRGRIPVVERTSLCDECQKCPHVKGKEWAA